MWLQSWGTFLALSRGLWPSKEPEVEGKGPHFGGLCTPGGMGMVAGRSPRGVQDPGCPLPPQSTSCPVRPQIHPAPGQHPGCGVPHSPPSSALAPGHQPPFLPMPFVIPKQVTPPGCSLQRAPRAQLATAETQKASARHRFQARIGQKTLSPPPGMKAPANGGWHVAAHRAIKAPCPCTRSRPMRIWGRDTRPRSVLVSEHRGERWHQWP